MMIFVIEQKLISLESYILILATIAGYVKKDWCWWREPWKFSFRLSLILAIVALAVDLPLKVEGGWIALVYYRDPMWDSFLLPPASFGCQLALLEDWMTAELSWECYLSFCAWASGMHCAVSSVTELAHPRPTGRWLICEWPSLTGVNWWEVLLTQVIALGVRLFYWVWLFITAYTCPAVGTLY